MGKRTNRLKGQDRFKLEKWIAERHEAIPSMTVKQLVTNATKDLKIKFTYSNVRTALEATDAPKPRVDRKRNEQVARAGVTLAVCEAIIAISSQFDLGVDPLITEYAERQKNKIRAEVARAKLNGEPADLFNGSH